MLMGRFGYFRSNAAVPETTDNILELQPFGEMSFPNASIGNPEMSWVLDSR